MIPTCGQGGNMIADLMVGTVVALAVQVNPISGDANNNFKNLWLHIQRYSRNSGNSEMPLNILELAGWTLTMDAC